MRPPNKMRFQTTITWVILMSGLLTAKGSFIEIATNNLGYFTNFSIGLSIGSGFHDFGKSPVCFVELSNNRIGNFARNQTNQDYFLNMPRENLFAIELLDASGKPVGKTDSGSQFGLPLTDKQVTDWYNKSISHANPRRSATLIAILPHEALPVGFFSIPEMFDIKEAGEYTLHVRMRLIMNMQFVWLPEATSKVQIRPEDILPPPGQTNTPAR